MKFKMSVKPERTVDQDKAYFFVFKNDQLLLFSGEHQYRIPGKADLTALDLQDINRHYLGTLGENPCYAVDLSLGEKIPGEVNYTGLREVFGLIDEELFRVASYAYQILHWDRTHQYCSICGARTGYGSGDRAKVCMKCGSIYYPRIAPAVIVAVCKGNKLLLVRNKRFKHNFYSVIAGFVEAGESLEECLVREVKEEAGIEVKNITYFGSQSWPFPNSLMIGFTAEYASGELKLDGKEIADAGWFSPESFPQIPGPVSIARQLIDAFVNQQIKM